jgi:hypothetical protein
LKIKIPIQLIELGFVGPLGLEPRLFYTKNRRVASYTMGHPKHNIPIVKQKAFSAIAGANLIQTLA